MKSWLFTVMTVLLQVHVWAGISTTQNPDIGGTNAQANCHTFKRVEHLVDIDTNYRLSNNNQWAVYPDMQVSFHLDFDQYVEVTYNIAISAPANYLFIYLIVDGQENKLFRGHHNDNYPVIFRYGKIFLKKGFHTILVKYHTDCNGQMRGDVQWQVAIFKVEYLKL